MQTSDILEAVCAIIPLFATVFIINNIYKMIVTKKYGERIEATVVNIEKEYSKAGVTYNIECQFKFNGRMIQKSYYSMRENNLNSIYIGKKYMVYYYPKYDYMVIGQQYKGDIAGGIMIAVIAVGGGVMLVLLVLYSMGYI